MANFTFCQRSAISLPCWGDLWAISQLFPLPPDFVIKYERSRRWQGDTDLRGWAAWTEALLQLQIYAMPILSQHFFFPLILKGLRCSSQLFWPSPPKAGVHSSEHITFLNGSTCLKQGLGGGGGKGWPSVRAEATSDWVLTVSFHPPLR